jgi:hypothetical protein
MTTMTSRAMVMLVEDVDVDGDVDVDVDFDFLEEERCPETLRSSVFVRTYEPISASPSSSPPMSVERTPPPVTFARFPGSNDWDGDDDGDGPETTPRAA